MTYWLKQDKLRCLFIGLLKNEVYFYEVKVICKPKDREWVLLLLIILSNLAVYRVVYSVFLFHSSLKQGMILS